jgi:diaminohydroxyphosphoribosylaminopyrimidine deaminase/5-amino-6-(5-phosphoribosylamino)uracil reductase
MASHIHADGPLTSLAGVLPLEFRSVDMLGPDLRILARVREKDAF